MAVYNTIDDPSKYFQATIYSGTGSAASVTNSGNSNLQPDFIWLKNRNGTRDHRLVDSTRGPTKEVVSNGTAVEFNEATVGVTAFQSDGFAHGGGNGYGQTGETYTSWQWKANGGTTSSNTSGSITSTVQANTTAGFSIATWTGTGANATIGHGLGGVPQMIIIKCRSAAHDWQVGNHLLAISDNPLAYNDPWTDYLVLNEANAAADHAGKWNDTAPTSTVFTVGDNGSINQDTKTFVGYFFRSINVYSKMGYYTGQANVDGRFVWTGFEPAFILWKNTDSGSTDWDIFDTARDAYNPAIKELLANDTNAESSSDVISVDILCNGFKLRTTNANANETTKNFIYMAFAGKPFATSSGVPNTAR